jgi:hypothetical protein
MYQKVQLEGVLVRSTIGSVCCYDDCARKRPKGIDLQAAASVSVGRIPCQRLDEAFRLPAGFPSVSVCANASKGIGDVRAAGRQHSII